MLKSKKPVRHSRRLGLPESCAENISFPSTISSLETRSTFPMQPNAVSISSINTKFLKTLMICGFHRGFSAETQPPNGVFRPMLQVTIERSARGKRPITSLMFCTSSSEFQGPKTCVQVLKSLDSQVDRTVVPHSECLGKRFYLLGDHYKASLGIGYLEILNVAKIIRSRGPLS